jgi:hypothetical protein
VTDVPAQIVVDDVDIETLAITEALTVIGVANTTPSHKPPCVVSVKNDVPENEGGGVQIAISGVLPSLFENDPPSGESQMAVTASGPITAPSAAVELFWHIVCGGPAVTIHCASAFPAINNNINDNTMPNLFIIGKFLRLKGYLTDKHCLI